MGIFIAIVTAFTLGFVFGRTSLFMKRANEEREKEKEEVELIHIPSTGYYIVPKSDKNTGNDTAKWVENEPSEEVPDAFDKSVCAALYTNDLKVERPIPLSRDNNYSAETAICDARGKRSIDNNTNFGVEIDKMYMDIAFQQLKQHTASITEQRNNEG